MEADVQDVFLAEIARQPDALSGAVAALHEQPAALAAVAGALDRGSGTVVLTGMGSSYDACLAAASLLGGAGILAVTVNAAELLHFRLPALDGDTLLIGVSQSGRSAELVRLVERLRRREPAARPTLVSITNGLTNPVAEAADIALDMAAGTEDGPSTMTFVASFAVLRTVVRLIAGAKPADALAALRADAAIAQMRLRDLLSDWRPLAERLATWLSGRNSLVLVGRGAARATAEVGALLLKEAARFPAECLDAAEFRHGPLELAGPDLAVAIIATEPQTYHLDRGLAVELAGHGSAVLLVTPADESIGGVTVLPIGQLDQTFAPAIAAVPLQLLAWQLAVQRQRRPGTFVTASKVTTRE